MSDRIPVILVAEDDPDDRLLAEEALTDSHIPCRVTFVRDGVDLLDYLHHRPPYTREDAPAPDLILLDLNMPRMDGRQALQQIKADPHLRRTPVVVLTTSRAEEDIVRAYHLGVNSFIVKPVTFEGLVHMVEVLTTYWFSTVRLPH